MRWYTFAVTEKEDASILKQKESMSEMIMDTFQEGFGVFCLREGKFAPVYLSSHIGSLTGQTTEEYLASLNDESCQFFHPLDKNNVHAAIQMALHRPENVTVSYRVRKKDGTYRWVKGIFSKYSGPGYDDAFCGAFLPLEDDDDLLISSLDNTSVALHIIDAESHEVYYSNEAGFSLFGLKPQPYDGRTCHEIFFGKEDPCPFCPLHNSSHDMLLPDGRIIALSNREAPWNGRKVIIEFCTDVTEERKEHDEMQELFSNNPGGLALFRWKDGILSPIMISETYRKLVGTRNDDRLKATSDFSYKMVHPDDLPGLQGAIKKGLEVDHSIDYVYRVKNETTGKWIWLHLQAKNSLQKDGSWLVYALYSDLTKAKEQTIALEASKAASVAKSDFLSRMSHEIRTPLNAILGLSALGVLNDDIETSKDYFSKIDSSGKFLLRLINDILDMSKIEQGKLEFHEEWTTGEKFFSDIADTMEFMAAKKGITLVSVFPKKPKNWVKMDTVRITQIHMNLLSNAIKYSENGSEVYWETCDTPLDDKRMRVDCTVKDHGCGMSEEYQKKLFSPFEQEYNKFTNTRPGTGLGLAIVKSLVDMMGGNISVESALGKGTTFHVSFVLQYSDAKPAGVVSAESNNPAPTLKGLRVLLAEDNQLNAFVSGRILAQAGVLVDFAQDGEKAVALFLDSMTHFYSAILMDIRMPVMDGYEATRRIRSSRHAAAKTIPIIAMTADAFSDDLKRSKEAGMDDYLSKPVDPAQLFHCLEKNIRK